MQQTENQKRLWKTTIGVEIIGIISFLFITNIMFAYGIERVTTYLYLGLYPIFIISFILVALKKNIGFYLSLSTSIVYIVMLTKEVGKTLVFETSNFVLYGVLILPYIIVLSIIPLAISYLSDKTEKRKKYQIFSILIAIGIFSFSILERFNKDYTDTIFINAKLIGNGKVKMECNPSFADTRTFFIETTSKELENTIKENGEFKQGSYFLANTKIKTNYRFNKLKSITLLEFKKGIKLPKITWNKNEIKGETKFISP